VDQQFYRPAEVDLLIGDTTKARAELGWAPTRTFQELVSAMVQNDLDVLSQNDGAEKSFVS
jgi:GDPmannose 4,6-dehydratase